MRRLVLSSLLPFLLFLPVQPALAAVDPAQVPFVRLNTETGGILLVLFPDLAPHHVQNFLHLAGTGFYDGTFFHRIVPGFVIQGGDPNTKDRDPRTDGQGGPSLTDVLTAAEHAELQKAGAILEARGYTGLVLDSRARLKAEFSPTALHLRGTLSMARSRDQDSAGSQFFICVDRAASLDRQYTIFGQVVTGMEAVDRIVSAEVNSAVGREYPRDPVRIVSCELLKGLGALSADEAAAYHATLKMLADAGSTW